MLKIVVFDSGYGGELFADCLEERLPVVEVIRIIDWRNANKIQSSPRAARKAAMKALGPYIGHVDLIVFANFLLASTSLKFFRRKFRGQLFVGLGLTHPGTFKHRSLVLTTSPLARTLTFRAYLRQLHRSIDTLCLDSWPSLIDDGELDSQHIELELDNFRAKRGYMPDEIIVACSQFRDIEPELRRLTRYNVNIHDSFAETLCDIAKTLRIRSTICSKRRKPAHKPRKPTYRILASQPLARHKRSTR